MRNNIEIILNNENINNQNSWKSELINAITHTPKVSHKDSISRAKNNSHKQPSRKHNGPENLELENPLQSIPDFDKMKNIPPLMSLLCSVCKAQGYTTSQSWKIFWNNASDAMREQVNIANLTAKMTEDSFKAQASISNIQSSAAYTTAFISLAAAGMAIVTAGIGEFKDPSSNIPTQEDATLSNVTENAENDAAISQESTQNQGFEQDIETTSDSINENSTWKNRFSKFKNFLSHVQKAGSKTLGSMLGRVYNAMIVSDMLSKIGTSFVDSKAKSSQADKEGLQGKAQAGVKISEQQSTFMGQTTSRTDSIAGQSSSQFDQLMQTLGTIISGLTQSARELLRPV